MSEPEVPVDQESPWDRVDDHLTRIEEVLFSIRVYIIAFFVMMLIFGLAYTVFLFYAMVIRPTSGGTR